MNVLISYPISVPAQRHNARNVAYLPPSLNGATVASGKDGGASAGVCNDRCTVAPFAERGWQDHRCTVASYFGRGGQLQENARGIFCSVVILLKFIVCDVI